MSILPLWKRCRALATGLRIEMLTYAEKKSVERLIFMVTALTHERRILIARTLAIEPMKLDCLCGKTRIPPMALRRHLDKLERRGFVRVENGVWMLIIPDETLMRRLIDSAVDENTPAQV